MGVGWGNWIGEKSQHDWGRREKKALNLLVSGDQVNTCIKQHIGIPFQGRSYICITAVKDLVLFVTQNTMSTDLH